MQKAQDASDMAYIRPRRRDAPYVSGDIGEQCIPFEIAPGKGFERKASLMIIAGIVAKNAATSRTYGQTDCGSVEISCAVRGTMKTCILSGAHSVVPPAQKSSSGAGGAETVRQGRNAERRMRVKGMLYPNIKILTAIWLTPPSNNISYFVSLISNI